MIYATYVYVTLLFTGFAWWVALGSNASTTTQMGAAVFACLGSALLVMMGLYELDAFFRRRRAANQKV